MVKREVELLTDVYGYVDVELLETICNTCYAAIHVNSHIDVEMIDFSYNVEGFKVVDKGMHNNERYIKIRIDNVCGAPAYDIAIFRSGEILSINDLICREG